jgi:hypothetical protein
VKNRPRPAIPVEVKCRVVLRQLEYGNQIENVIAHHRADFTVAPSYRRTHGKLLASILPLLAARFNCDVADLRLDHEPALRVRKYNPRIKKVAARYTPNANDPEAMLYRPHGAQFDGSHHIKTNVRGDRGQFPDRVLIKRERKREKKAEGRSRTPSFQRQKVHATIPARPNPWPPRGSRPLRG